MIERFVAPALTFALLLGGHFAIGSRLLMGPAAQPAALTATAAPAAYPQVVQLEPVIIMAKRAS